MTDSFLFGVQLLSHDASLKVKREDLCGDVVELRGGRDVGDADFVQDDFATRRFEFVFDVADTLPAPAVTAERERFVIGGTQALEVAQERGNRRHHLIVNRRRADSQIFARKNIRDNIGQRRCFDVVKGGGNSALCKSFGNRNW